MGDFFFFIGDGPNLQLQWFLNSVRKQKLAVLCNRRCIDWWSFSIECRLGSLSDEKSIEDFGFVDVLFHEAAGIIKQGWCERRLALGENCEKLVV